jgi:hypothetical protein
MDPIKPLSALNALLGQRLASRRSEQGAATGKAAHPAPGSTVATAGGGAVTLEELRRCISEAVQSIEPTDPDRRRKTARVFAGHVLRWQFGDDILNDPRFAELLDEVGAVLELEGDGLLAALDDPGRGSSD